VRNSATHSRHQPATCRRFTALVAFTQSARRLAQLHPTCRCWPLPRTGRAQPPGATLGQRNHPGAPGCDYRRHGSIGRPSHAVDSPLPARWPSCGCGRISTSDRVLHQPHRRPPPRRRRPRLSVNLIQVDHRLRVGILLARRPR
jgi:hypothetical protein